MCRAYTTLSLLCFHPGLRAFASLRTTAWAILCRAFGSQDKASAIVKVGGGDFAFCEGSNTILAFGFMQGLGIEKMCILNVNNADGALIYESFWKCNLQRETIGASLMMDKVNIKNKFELFDEYWTPKIVGDLNENHIKLFKAKGELVWHQHENEDEFFLVVKGQLKIKLRDREIVLNEGEFFIVPKGVDHLPYAEKEAHVLLVEPKQVINTGNVVSEQTVKNLDRI